MNEPTDSTSIALMSQKLDHYREELIRDRSGTKDQLTSIQTLLEAHVAPIRAELDDHDERITRNADEIAALKVAHSRTTGFLVALGSVATAIAGYIGSLFSGLWAGPPHH